MAQITKREIFIDGILSQTLTAPPFDKITLPPMSSGTHTTYSKVYVNGALAVTEPTITFKVEFPTPIEGLVSDYTFDETTGGAIDTVGAHNGTVSGGVTRNGTSYVFDGTSGYVNIPDNDDHSFVDVAGNDTPFTIRMIINFTSLAGSQWIINRRGNTTTLQEFQIVNYGGQIQVFIYNKTGDVYIGRAFVNSEITAGVDYHFVTTYNGSGTSDGVSMYFNKVEKDAFNEEKNIISYESTQNAANETVIGRAAFNSSFYFNGSIKKLRIHKGYNWNKKEIDKDFTQVMV